MKVRDQTSLQAVQAVPLLPVLPMSRLIVRTILIMSLPTGMTRTEVANPKQLDAGPVSMVAGRG